MDKMIVIRSVYVVWDFSEKRIGKENNLAEKEDVKKKSFKAKYKNKFSFFLDCFARIIQLKLNFYRI